MTRLYHEDDIRKSFKWLADNWDGYMELLAVHKDYRPGQANFRENLRHGRLPKIRYVKEAAQVLAFVRSFSADHTCYFGVNPRPTILRNARGLAKSATEADIKVVTNFFFDLDCLEKDLTGEYLAEVQFLLARTDWFFEAIGLKPPIRAFSGGGFHLLFALPPVLVRDFPDIKMKLHEFLRQFVAGFRKDFERLNVRVDSTLDLRRMAKIYGTKKATAGTHRISEFYGGKREEDPALKDYLASLKVRETRPSRRTVLKCGSGLSPKFRTLLESDSTLKGLWDGVGKTDGDVSRTGYDFSLARACIMKGITDMDELASILAQRPGGACRRSGKGQDYIKRTIAKALMSC